MILLTRLSLFFRFCLRLRQCSFHLIVRDGVLSEISVLLPTPSVWFSLDRIALRFWLRLRLRLRRSWKPAFTTHHFTVREDMNSINWPRSQCVASYTSSVGWASHRYRGGHGFDSRWSPDFFRLLSNCLNWKSYCDDHSSLSSTTTVQIWIISYILHMKSSA